MEEIRIINMRIGDCVRSHLTSQSGLSTKAGLRFFVPNVGESSFLWTERWFPAIRALSLQHYNSKNAIPKVNGMFATVDLLVEKYKIQVL